MVTLNPSAFGKSHRFAGMTLLELMIALTLGALLLLGLVQITSAASSSTRLQRNQAQLQENARLALSLLGRHVREAGFDPSPWEGEKPELGLGAESSDNGSNGSDRIVTRAWSDLNCFDNRNPELDASGQPAFYVRESAFELNSSRGLTWQCRFGPSLTELVTQVRRQGLIENVDSFQVLYGEGSNGEGTIKQWVNAGDWASPGDILGIKVGLLLGSSDHVLEQKPRTFEVLDSIHHFHTDGFLRRVFQFSVAIRNKTG
jgi:type IV pilus assembly protein PilW